MKGLLYRLVFVFSTCCLLTAVTSLTALAQENILTAADCNKCHIEQPAEIQAAGAAHKTAIDCTACHQSHRPMVAENIPACSDCHSGSSHYEVPECMSCHDPHQPLDLNLEGELKAVCESCHAGPSEQMAASPSVHAEVACNFCHADTHGYIPDCTDCHSPHSETMAEADCAICHQAHKPMELAYSDDTGSQLCASCHDTAYNELAGSTTKHNTVACVTCHVDQHGMIPQCSDCHGMPHAEAMHAKFPQCGDCHSTAHDLNNWPGQ